MYTMKQVLISATFILLCAFTSKISQAAKIRVNNNVGVSADYTDIPTAITNAFAGDTIYVEGSANSYGNITLAKKLYIIGPGYFLTENDSTQANPSQAEIGQVSFNAGSAGSVISGMAITSQVIINEDNITVKRNNITSNYGVTVNGQANIMILQNFIVSTYNGSSYPTIDINTGSSNVFIQNNFIKRTYGTTYINISVEGTSSATVVNNIIENGIIDAVNSVFNNNIMIGGGVTCTACSFDRNIGDNTQFASDPNNLQSVTMSTVFDFSNPSPDAKWRVLNGSAAKGYGVSGEDCGMFGGPDPYVLSGLPGVPSIFFYIGPSSGSQSSGLPVNIKVRSNK